MWHDFLSFLPPLFGQEEFDEAIDTLRSDWITTGPKTKRFEQEFAQFISAPATLAVSSATEAMPVVLAQGFGQLVRVPAKAGEIRSLF